MAAAIFNQLVDPLKAQAMSAGTEPGERVHPEVLVVMHEIGIDLRYAKPQKLTEELAKDAQLLITMGCGDQCRKQWPSIYAESPRHSSPPTQPAFWLLPKVSSAGARGPAKVQ